MDQIAFQASTDIAAALLITGSSIPLILRKVPLAVISACLMSYRKARRMEKSHSQ